MPTKQKKQNWITMTDKESGNRTVIPMNRAARRAYAKQNGFGYFPPVLLPYTKPTEASTEDKGKLNKDNK